MPIIDYSVFLFDVNTTSCSPFQLGSICIAVYTLVELSFGSFVRGVDLVVLIPAGDCRESVSINGVVRYELTTVIPPF